MNRLPFSKQEQVIHLLLEGCSIRSVTRLTGVHRETIAKLLLRAGANCEVLMREHVHNFHSDLLEVDEAWTYVGKKDKALKPRERGSSELGSQWIFIAMCRKTKLIPAFAVGKRTVTVAALLMDQLSRRIEGRTRIVTDALEAYREAVETVFGSAVDYATMTKCFENGTSCVFPVHVQGRIENDLVSTSLIERRNLTLRNFVRRLARRTICFSKKLENLKAALAIHFCWYNFCRIHRLPPMHSGDGGRVG